jgi:undecaprenyl diphosphate synthase
MASRFSSSTRTLPETGAVPAHVAIIMDGNGRWARRRALPHIAGHRQGMTALRDVIEGCVARGVRYLTVFAFSSENWRRPEKEVGLLMELFAQALQKQVRKLNENGVRLRIVGDLTRFSKRIQLLIHDAEHLTHANTKLHLTVAANYGGRWDIMQACRQIAQEAAAGRLDPATVEQETLESRLATAFLPEPDLFIRTGGEERISNFLLWQLAYAELYFTDTLWPDFGRAELDKAITSFARRERRFGQTGDQIPTRKQA